MSSRRWLRRLAACSLCAGFALALAGCDRAFRPEGGAGAAAALDPLFVEVAQGSGIDFRHVNGMAGDFQYAEVIGSGVALFDFDNDGRLDVLVLQGKPLTQAGEPAGEPAGACLARLYRNEGGQARQLRFKDVTGASGLCSRGDGMGVSVGGIDGDRCADVFLTHFGTPNQWWRNRCDGTFEDVTRTAGLAGDGRWGASASFDDFDRDGRLDLYVANDFRYRVADNKKCDSSTGLRDDCAPSAYPNEPAILYRNRGDGRFEDVSARSGITAVYGAGLGVMAVDLTGDGWPDIFVANDGNPNQLWVNQKDGTFRDEALLRGSAVNPDGAALPRPA